MAFTDGCWAKARRDSAKTVVSMVTSSASSMSPIMAAPRARLPSRACEQADAVVEQPLLRLQLVQRGQRSAPLGRVSLGGERQVQVRKESQHVGAYLGIYGGRLLLGQPDGELAIRVIRQRVLPGPGRFAGIEIAVGQGQFGATLIVQKSAIDRQRAVETLLKELLRLGRGRFESERPQRPNLGQNAHQESQQPGADTPFPVRAGPFLAIARLRE